MREYTIVIPVKQYDSIDELNTVEQQLANAAIKACESSYAPFSEFNVGAALLLENGQIIKGSNQENVAYPSGLCAERTAMYYANSEYPDSPIVAIAVTSAIKGIINAAPVRPCGACRQAISQSELRFSNNIKMIMIGSDKIDVVNSIKLLLPLSFDISDYK